MTNKFYQTLKETLSSIRHVKKESALVLLASSIGLLQGCTVKVGSQYNYNGRVGQDSVKFEKAIGYFHDNWNYLTIYNKNGSSIKLKDHLRNDLKFERIIITKKDGSRKLYCINDKKVEKYVVEGWQAKADSVLPKILKIKRQSQIKEGLKYLK